MATATARVHRQQRIDAPPEAVWPHVSDADRIVALMESLQSSVPLGDDRYRWTMRPYGAFGYRVVPEADLHILWHPPERIAFEPVGEAAERARAAGQLLVAPTADGATLVEIRADIEIDLPIPRVLSAGAASLLSRELGAGFERFLRRLARVATADAQQPPGPVQPST